MEMSYIKKIPRSILQGYNLHMSTIDLISVGHKQCSWRYINKAFYTISTAFYNTFFHISNNDKEAQPTSQEDL